MTYDIIVSIYSARKPGDKTKSGSESLDTFASFAGVSLLDTPVEGVTVGDRIPGGGWQIDGEVRGLGQPPYRKTVKIKLPAGVIAGEYRIANVTMLGLHSTYSTNDGMGKAVYVYCNKSVQVGEDRESAIDAAIKSGILLSVPSKDGKRHEVRAEVVAVSDMYGDQAPDRWTR